MLNIERPTAHQSSITFFFIHPVVPEEPIVPEEAIVPYYTQYLYNTCKYIAIWGL